MTLKELKISSYLAKTISGDEKSYLKITNTKLDLTKEADSATVLKFLNDWGCRQFKKDNHKDAAEDLKWWYRKNESSLPSFTQTLSEHSDNKIKSYSKIFDELQYSYASTDKRGIIKSVGPVGAAKILFALRKQAFPPWDNPIIESLGKSRSGDGYVSYLFYIKEKIAELKRECDRKGINVKIVPKLLERPHASLVKLVDEYLWLTITRKIEPSKIISIAKNAS